MGKPRESGRFRARQQEATARRRAEGADLRVLLKDAVIANIEGIQGTQFIFPPDVIDSKTIHDIKEPLNLLGLLPHDSGTHELRFAGRTMYSISFVADDPRINEIIWQYNDDGSLAHEHLNELRPITREAAMLELHKIFSGRAKMSFP